MGVGVMAFVPPQAKLKASSRIRNSSLVLRANIAAPPGIPKLASPSRGNPLEERVFFIPPWSDKEVTICGRISALTAPAVARVASHSHLLRPSRPLGEGHIGYRPIYVRRVSETGFPDPPQLHGPFLCPCGQELPIRRKGPGARPARLNLQGAQEGAVHNPPQLNGALGGDARVTPSEGSRHPSARDRRCAPGGSESQHRPIGGEGEFAQASGMLQGLDESAIAHLPQRDRFLIKACGGQEPDIGGKAAHARICRPRRPEVCHQGREALPGPG